MRKHTWVWAALAWLGVVVVVSTVTWTVIDSAGRNVLAQDDGPGAGALPTSSAQLPGEPSPGAAEPGVTLSAPSTPTLAPSRVTSPASVSPSPSTSPAAPTSASASGVTRTWQGTAGTVTVRCVGDRINLQSASPGDGWRVEVATQGPEEVEVDLTSGVEDDDEGDEREVHVRARCEGGTPRFEVEQD